MYKNLFFSVVFFVSYVQCSDESWDNEWYEEILPRTKASLQIPFPYLSLEEAEKEMPYLDAGCCTVLTKPGQKVLVGLIGSRQLIALHNNGKTIVANKDECASLRSLITIIREEINQNVLSKTKGLVFTNISPLYDAPKEDGPSLQDGYQGRTQVQEVSYIARRLIDELYIADKNYITKRIFGTEHNDEKEGAPAHFVIVEHREKDAECFMTCPISECLFGLSPDLPDSEALVALEKKIDIIQSKNPYLISILAKTLTVEQWKTSYEQFSFARV
jgi:hypothetical protein